ncbi:MFS transporter [Dactylosporangium sp. CA-233914]|uniref:MFS transporter n=1 Tax=Dactylosporangium sp. CA-233914 TaxID=3239934 RepID=UPI003D8AFC84
MTDVMPGRDSATHASKGRWLGLGVIAAAQLMTALDATIVNIALPSAQSDLAFGDAQRQWVVTAYTVCFAGLLLLGGRVADVLGRRRAFQIGLVGFALASLVAGLAPTLPVLVAGRALQGAFAALIAPTALSLLAVTFTEQRERARAFAVYGAVASSGAGAGLLLGGVLTEYLDWRWCLFVNVLIAAIVLAVGRSVLPDPPRFGSARIDAMSAGLATGGLAALVFGCNQAARHGWTSALVLGWLAAGVCALAGFGLRQWRMASPLLPLRLLTDRNRAGAYVAAATAVVGAFGMFLLLTYHLQVVLGYSPARAGLAVLPMTLANSLSGYQLGNRLMLRVAPRILIAGGLLIAASGLAVMTQLTPHSGYFTIVLPAEVLIGAGMGALFPPAFQLAIRGVTPRDAGVASAVINAAAQVGGSIGTAAINALAVSSTAAYLATHAPSPSRQVAALVHGYVYATAWSTALLTVMAVLVFVLVTSPRGQHGQPGQPDRANGEVSTSKEH